MRADSSRLSGIPEKKFRMITKLKALISTGSTSDHSESSRPSLLTTMKVGIIPPLNSMVNTTMKLMTRRPTSRGLARAYAISAVTSRLRKVPPTVTIVETPMARKMVGVERM